MKFILGYIKGSRSKFYNGPKLIWNVRSDHGGKSYEFDRLEKDKHTGIALPKLKVYDSDDYPEALIKALLDSGLIVEFCEKGR